jgi:hypothetical protein
MIGVPIGRMLGAFVFSQTRPNFDVGQVSADGPIVVDAEKAELIDLIAWAWKHSPQLVSQALARAYNLETPTGVLRH